MQIQFTLEEERMIEEFSEKIDLQDKMSLLNYGCAVQKKAASLSSQLLEETLEEKAADLRSVLEKLQEMISELEQEDRKKPFFMQEEKFSTERKLKLEKTNLELNRMTDELLLLQSDLQKEVLLLGKLQEKNERYHKELTMYLLAGKKKVENESVVKCDQFEKKLYDLEVSQMLCLQLEAQICMLQKNYAKLYEEIQCAVNQTIPFCKNQMAMIMN